MRIEELERVRCELQSQGEELNTRTDRLKKHLKQEAQLRRQAEGTRDRMAAEIKKVWNQRLNEWFQHFYR